MVKVAIDTFLALDDKTICLALPFLYQNGVQFEFQVIDHFLLPASQRKDVVIERGASVGADIEMLAMLLLTSSLFCAII